MIAQVDARLDVLRPFVREFEQLGIAREALAGAVLDSPAPARSRRERPSAPRRARRAPRGANREAIVKVAGSRPGVTVAEIADQTGIGKPTVHSTVYALKRRGVLEAQGDGVRLAGARAQPAGAAPARSGAARRSKNARGTRRRRAASARGRRAGVRAGDSARVRPATAGAAVAPRAASAAGRPAADATAAPAPTTPGESSATTPKANVK
jgi:hypothetical protein